MSKEFVWKTKINRCCVPNCKNLDGKRHRFPIKYPEIFKIWVDRIKPRGYDSLSTNKIYGRYVCQAHFSPRYFVHSRRGLALNAIPSLKIPGFVEEEHNDIPPDPLTLSELPDPLLLPALPDPLALPALPDPLALPALPEPANNATPNEILIISSDDEDIISEHENETIKIVPKVKKKLSSRKKNSLRLFNLFPKVDLRYNILKYFIVHMSQISRNIKNYKHRLRVAKKYINSKEFAYLQKLINDPIHCFMMHQLLKQHSLQKTVPHSLNERILTLPLFIRIGKAYLFLSSIFGLPSSRSLNTLLRKVTFRPGINQHLLDNLKEKVYKMKHFREKLCSLTFYEIGVKPKISYDIETNELIGFKDNGLDRKPIPANGICVIIVKGLYKQWKEPIGFTLTEGSVKPLIFKNLIKRTVRECQKIGLDVVMTFCNYDTKSRIAVGELIKDTKYECLQQKTENPYHGFLVNDREVVPLYDVDQLFNQFRNRLFKDNLTFIMNGKSKTAMWDHLKTFYQLDMSEPNLRLCPKLTDIHVYKRNNTDIRICKNVFSYQVGTLIKRISQWDTIHENNLPLDAEDTADLILFLDKLYDSLKVSKISKHQNVPLKGPITIDSGHQKFWKESLDIIDSFMFFCSKKMIYMKSPVINNLYSAVLRYCYLTDILLRSNNFKHVLKGSFNRAPLTDFLNSKNHKTKHRDLNASHVISFFKTSIINNFLSKSKLKGDLCMADLDKLRSLPYDTPMSLDRFTAMTSEMHLQGKSKISRWSLAYMSRTIIKILFKSYQIKNCKNCRFNLKSRYNLSHDFMNNAYDEEQNFVHPTHYLNFLFRQSLQYLFYLIPKLSTEKQILKVLQSILEQILYFNAFDCPVHNLKEEVCRVIITCALYWRCKGINNICEDSSKSLERLLYPNTSTNVIDPIKLKVYDEFQMKM